MEYTAWYSNDPNDCPSQWIYTGFGDPTPPPPPGMTNNPDDYQYSSWTASIDDGDCPLPNNCIETCDPGLVVTTSFQIEEVVTTTSWSDGAAATITTNIAVMKTAVGTPGGRVWMLAETPAMTLHTLTDSSGRPTATVAEFLETLTNSNDVPTETKTVTSTGSLSRH